jgi:hypothetical protein
MTMPLSRITLLTLAVLPLLACNSEPGTQHEMEHEAAGETGHEIDECGSPPKPGPAPIRRLTRVEYNNTIYQLFGDNSQPANAFPPDEEAGGFDNQADVLVVSPLLTESYLSAAENLAAAHTPTLMQQLPNCQGDTVDEATCAMDADAFVRSFGSSPFAGH